ncbi:NADH dehydrogenase [ubiquinone] 1 alpha subcomplex assembly factor 4 [Dunckerocampus dactyliophorus]|uniref:NADH dehydrogenase [ubiquinone] 1 alpha subcomplex assembly factor 4 n=1 Tax=Dunckerocampus dactyliophorus TaxID=161453 RepID=UPI002404E72B|nr:NADH dehydrogenase [ubiquinone] 1 alpha subcomplex assembly factor 4 [Dunckerocampus dactyliophorus]
MKTEEDNELVLLNMGARVVRMFRNFNLENRVQREISKEKPRSAPRHAVTQADFTRHEGDGGAVHQKNNPLLSNLKSVYVESTDTHAGTRKMVTKEASTEEETKYRATKFFIPGDSHGIANLTEVPQGKLTITEALKAVGSHHNEPQTWTSQRIAQEYSLDLKETNSLLEFFIPFQVHILPPETVKQLKSS